MSRLRWPLVGLALLVSSLSVASVMVFRIKVGLLASDGGVTSASGSNVLALPYRPRTGLTKASLLMNDIGFANVAFVSRFLEATDSFVTYTGRKGSATDFDLLPGEAYFVKMTTTTHYIIGGAHDPTTQVSLDGPGASSASGTNLYAPPYGTIPRTAKQLMDDIGFANVINVQCFLRATDSFQVYTGRKGSAPDFPLEVGVGYFVKMNTTVNYIPSHY